MNTDILIISGLFGYCYFLYNLESKGMGNIIIRCGKFTPSNILSYMKSPFYQWFLWHPNLWSSNWIITTFISIGIGYGVSLLW